MRKTELITRARKYWPVAALLACGLILTLALGARLFAVVKLALWSLLIAYLLSPLVSKLQRSVKRPLAVALAFLIALSVLAALLCAVVLPALMQFGQLASYLPALAERLEDGAQALSEFAGARGVRVDPARLFVDERVKQAALGFLESAFGYMRYAVQFFTRFIVAMVLAFFNLLQWERVSLRITLFIPAPARPTAIRVSGAVRREMGMYLRGQAILVACMSVLTVLALTLIGAPSPLALGLMYGLMNALPYFGPLLGTIPPVLAALAVNAQTALITLAALIVIQQIDNYVLSPRVIGAYSGMSPAAVLLALSAGSCLGGIAGMFVAMPVMLAVRVALRVCLSARPAKT